MKQPTLSSSPDVMGGTHVFSGTRVPVQTLLDYLAAGETIDDFLEGFPMVDREQVIAFLEEVKDPKGEAGIAAWTPEQLNEALAVAPMTGTEIVNAGLTGGWSDVEISDGVEWVREKRRQRSEERRLGRTASQTSF
jgi:uncharacterized protein (DUF433 family)